ncbi:glycosyl transferase [Thozetella sp. PMI_491]|nr:glycosyl transferase [Thozetella sp. PMI_491]
MGLTYLGLSAVGWRSMSGSLWEQILGLFLLGTLVLALSPLIYTCGRLIAQHIKRHRHGASFIRPVSNYLKELKGKTSQLPIRLSSESRQAITPKSFGVYLGGLTDPPTDEQLRLLNLWDVFVVDPLQPGVVGGLACHTPSSSHILARFDVPVLVKADASFRSKDVIKNLGILLDAVATRLVWTTDRQVSPFTGLLLANFSKYFPPPIMNELARHIHSLGLGIWLELSYPDYLTEDEARAIDMKLFQGVVYRNGMIRTDGDRQNYFHMTTMRTVMRAVAFQTVGRSLPLAMWETVDDDKELQYAVVARCHKLCTFYNSMCWIGHASALMSAESAETRTLAARPLGALMWLKDEAMMRVHTLWRTNNDVCPSAVDNDAVYESLSTFVPELPSRLRLIPQNDTPRESRVQSDVISMGEDSNESIVGRHSDIDPLSTSSKGHGFTGLGCFQLGHEPTFVEYYELLESQRRLEDLGLLARVKAAELAEVRAEIAILHNSQNLGSMSSRSINSLLELLSTADQDDDSRTARIKVFTGLHSAFQTESGTQYWGLYNIESGAESGIIMYLSKNAGSVAGTILHTYLSSQHCSRTECFLAEQAMVEANGSGGASELFSRLARDIELLSPSEAILLMDRVQTSQHQAPLIKKIHDRLEYQLLDMPTLNQQRALCAPAYLGGEISAESLIASRLSWLASKGCSIPDQAAALALFKQIQERLNTVLMTCQSDVYAQISSAMQALLKEGHIDAGVDILTLSVFCAFRNFALDEVYLEVLDRNVYPNHATDQAGCFSEHFALGSRCDSFFDTNARNVGRIIAGRYREYYMEHQPPIREDGFTELPTTYAAMQTDFDRRSGPEKLPFYHHVTFFGIFAVPALIDVTLLTTIGRGLFLTTFMTSEEKTTATMALMLALLISGAFGAWICSGGSYYFFASAFPAMNLFVLTRFVAGVAFTILAAVIGFVVFACVYGVTAALTFAFYLVMLSTYMMALSALSIYQLPGSSFLSGRTAILSCVPILLISPVVSIFTEHDIIVYVPVLSTFLATILFNAWSIIGRWSSWYLNIPFVTDVEVLKWYRAEATASSIDTEKLSDAAVMNVARSALHAAVLKECHRSFFSKPSTDPLVIKLANGYKPSMFLMHWYSRHKRSLMPLQYSSTWNLMMKAAMENMTNMQKGLKLHSAFLHWRTTGLDIWSGLLYFLVALTDKWVAVFTGANLVGLSAASSEKFRLGVGWGLCYYLLSALLLDIISQPLWTKANEYSDKQVTSLKHLDEVTRDHDLSRRKLYWRNLTKCLFLHLWAAAAFSAFMWIFQDSGDNTIMFLSYIGAYSGLLFYQYNKIFCGTDGAAPLAIGAAIGFPTGFVLHVFMPEFPFSGAISLATATWVSGFLSLWVAMRWPYFRTQISKIPRKNDETRVLEAYSVTSLEPHPDISHATMNRMFDAAQRLQPDKRYVLNPREQPGTRIVELLAAPKPLELSSTLQAAFPLANELTYLASKWWQEGKTTVELISSHDFPPSDPGVRTICHKTNTSLHIFIILGSGGMHNRQTLSIPRIWRIVAEAIISATAEHWLGYSHRDAILAELLVAEHVQFGELWVPEGVKHQLDTSPKDRARMVQAGDRTLLRYALLGVDSEIEWDQLPRPVRCFLLCRLGGSSVRVSEDIEAWLLKRYETYGTHDIDEVVARSDLGAILTRAVLAYGKDSEFESLGTSSSDLENLSESHQLLSEWAPDGSTASIVRGKPLSSFIHGFKVAVKFLVISLTADPEYQRELDYVIRGVPSVFRWPIVFFLNSIWLYCKFLQGLIVPIILLHGRNQATKIQKLTKGIETVMEKNRIVTETLSGTSTWFWTIQENGNIRLAQHGGRHGSEPEEGNQLKAVNFYTNTLRLLRRELYSNGSVIKSFQYHYQDGTSKVPMQRDCTAGDGEGEMIHYDHRGYVVGGSDTREGNRVTWKLWYRKNAKYDAELLWGEYTFPHITIKVLWSMSPRNPQSRLEEWIPFSTVTEATFIQGGETYHASWDYEHKFHPEVAVTLNGTPVPTPLMIKEDWFHVLEKPENCSFLSENPLFSFSSIKTNAISRFLRFNIKRYPIPTSVARTHLWKTWKSSQDVDAISARWLDEKLVRSDSTTGPYWRLRDIGRLGAATAYLDFQADAIMARVDIDPQTSSWTHLAFKISDLYSFGEGGNACINTRKVDTQLSDSEKELHVLAMDTSTWPIDPGGVSNCRRDMINNLESIKWHVVAETANDYGVPRYQMERNVNSLTILPLWGLDFLNPTHGVLETTLDSAVVQRSVNTKMSDIEQNFLPILTSLVTCARAVKLNRRHIEEATRALLDLNTYFETSRNWNDVWSSPLVKQRWRELWLSESMKENAVTISHWWDFEKPTLKHLDDALNLWCRYLFIFALPVPDQIPEVFQASHHFCGAMYGIVCKIKRKCSLHIWDHCISYREFTTFMSSAVSYDSPFVNSSLISLTYLGCVLIEHHADVVLPCCDYFNPAWEVELGTADGTLEHRRVFARKIDPVVNGISNMESFQPIDTIKTDTPTVIMLSHMQYPKDIKNAILSCDFIVNKWGFKDYRLHIYGERERHAGLATECQEIIASKGLQHHCVIMGLGNPSVVLQTAWLFLNSSISEGLPLAMGEAALTGCPVVCTDVGASYVVVTDRATGHRFSEVVSPNDPESLARAQVSVLALLGPWAAYAEDAPGTDVPVLEYPVPSPEQVHRISERMYSKIQQRRALGLRGRQNVLGNFSAKRYLREHEQMLWIGKERSPAHRTRVAAARGSTTPMSIDLSVSRPQLAYTTRSRRMSRLTPESWVRLAIEKEGKWWSRSSSTLGGSIISWRDKEHRAHV